MPSFDPILPPPTHLPPMQTQKIRRTPDVEEGEESMDWEDINVENLLKVSKSVRSNTTVEIIEQENASSNTSDDNIEGEIVVVDTNIFLSALPLLETMRKMTRLYVAWQVLQELDRHKTGEELGKRARAAVRWIRNNMEGDRVRGQSVKHHFKSAREQFPGEKCEPDDRIIATCLQLRKEGASPVVLMTEDINLANKAVSNGMRAVQTKEVKQIVEEQRKTEEEKNVQMPMVS